MTHGVPSSCEQDAKLTFQKSQKIILVKNAEITCLILIIKNQQIINHFQYIFTNPSTTTTQRRPFSNGLLKTFFVRIPSLRALFIEYATDLGLPLCHDGTRPHCIGWTTQTHSLSILSAASSVPESVSSDSSFFASASSSKCFFAVKTGLITKVRYRNIYNQ